MGMSDFQTQLQACLPDLWRYGMSLTRNRDAADDLLQDAVERALRKQHLYQPTGTVKAWSMTVLLNVFRSQKQRDTRRPDPAPIETVANLPASDPLEHHLALGETARALDTLPEEQRDALLTVVIGGLSYKEAAETLDLPIGTLMSRLGRARAGLRAATQTKAPAP
jgi:RNA polymerase sigma-70 factor (ECF subfamily)